MAAFLEVALIFSVLRIFDAEAFLATCIFFAAFLFDPVRAEVFFATVVFCAFIVLFVVPLRVVLAFEVGLFTFFLGIIFIYSVFSVFCHQLTIIIPK